MARVDARRLLSDVESEARRGWPAGLTVLHGDDLYHLDRAQRVILRALEDGLDPEFGRTTFGDDKVDVATVVTAVRSVGMFAPRRIVFVREVAALTADDDTLLALTDYAGAPPPASHLVVRAPVLDLRRKLHKALAQAGRTLEFGLPPEGERRLALAREVLDELARERGLVLDREAIELLAELAAADLERIERELDKIAAWVDSTDPRVTAQTVLEVAAGGGLVSGWAAAEGFTRRDHGGTLAALRRNIDSGEPALRVLGGLAWRARVLLQAKALSDARVPMRKVVEATRAWRFEADLAAGLARYRLEDLRDTPAALLAADRALKSSGFPPGAVLEALADRLMGRKR